MKQTTSIICFLFIYSMSYAQNVTYDKHVNLGKAINSAFDEQNPVLSQDGNTLYFTRRSHPLNLGGRKDKGDIWYSIKSDSGTWLKAKNLGFPLNNIHKNSILGFSADGSIMYLGSLYSSTGAKPTKQGLSYSLRNGNSWSFPKALDVPYFLNKSDHESITVSADGKVMIMAIESYSTLGAEDLYVSFLQADNSWSEPRNLGSKINTPLQEMTPYLSSNNELLFFSSNGHAGFGSRDVFVAKRLDNSWRNWSKPENLGDNVNTVGMELSFVLPHGASYAYLVSTQNSDGYGDINRVNIIQPDSIKRANEKYIVVEQEPEMSETIGIGKIKVVGKVIDESNGKIIPALITYTRIIDKTVVASVPTNEFTGEYITILARSEEYRVKVASKGYMSTEESLFLDTMAGTELPVDYALRPLSVGSTIKLDHVYFQRGKAILLVNSYGELNLLVDILNENPDIKIELEGHTDGGGAAHLNLKLSEERVDAVMTYLISKGVEKRRLSGKGFGGTKPIASNKTEETKKLNRRVEFKIIKN